MLGAGFGGRHRVILDIDGAVLVDVVFLFVVVGVVGVAIEFIIVVDDHVTVVVIGFEIDVVIGARTTRTLPRRRVQLQAAGQYRRGMHRHCTGQRLQTGPPEIVVEWRWVQQ